MFGQTEIVARSSDGMVALGHGVFVRADRIIAVVPIESPARGDGARAYVHVDGLPEPVIASRSERAIFADLRAAATSAAHRRRFRRSASS